MKMEYKGGMEDLEVWKEAREFRKVISDLTRHFPMDEKFRLADQLQRSSRSVTANIAEGYGRFHYQENIQYCRQARGSLVETLDHLICAYDEQLINEKEFTELRSSYEKVLKLLNGYISFLKRKKTAPLQT